MKRLFFTAIFCLVAAGVCFAQNDMQTVAIVNLIKQEPISVRQLKTELAPLEKSIGRSLQVSERRQALDDLVNQRLILQAAERDRVTVSTADIDNAVNSLRNQLAQQIGRRPTEAEFTQALQQNGTTMAGIREQARKQLLIERYVMAKKQSLFQSIREPTEEEILRVYNLNKVKFVRPDMVRISLISIPYGADSSAKAKAKETADRLAREIGNNPDKFDEAALKGQAPNAGYGADRGFYISRTQEAQQQTGEQFLNIAFSLKQGEVSSLIENASIAAYQFIKVTEIYPYQTLQLDDIMDPANPVTVRNYISQNLADVKSQQLWQQALKELIDELRKDKTAVTIYDQYLNW
jgi:parvulin-like peptidyl-prolyl isomerase